jgi:tetratricopeptide (TPR) repeat protein
LKKIGRNDPCHCSSGKKYKLCCEHKNLIDEINAANSQSIDTLPAAKLIHAIEHHQNGRFDQAELLYQQILEVVPNHADALNLSGLIAYQRGNITIAIDLISNAIIAKPFEHSYHYNLGVVFQAQGRPDEATICYRQALSIKPDYADAYYNLGNVFKVQGRLDDAVVCYRQVLSIKPDYAEAYSNLGNALQAQNRLNDAIACYRQALSIKPDYAEVHSNLGNALKAQNRLDDAIVCYQQALSIKPGYAEAHSNLGNALKAQNRLDDAIACYQQALSIKPDYAEALSNLGNALKAQNRLDDAITCYQQALSIKPDYAEVHSNLGVVLKEQGQLEKAAVCFRRALSIQSDYAEAHSNLGVALQAQGLLDEAVASFRQAILIKPDYAEAFYNLGNAFYVQDKLEDTIACYLQAISNKPDYAEAYSNLGNALHAQGQLDEAIACYRQALVIKPNDIEASYNLSFPLLQQGKMEEGWSRYEKNCMVIDSRKIGIQFESTAWDGTPLEGRTLFIHTPQGLGDCLQFMRYVPMAKTRGGRIIVELHPAMCRLYENYPGIDAIVMSNKPQPEFDAHIPLMSLPYLFGTRMDTIPPIVPFHHALNEPVMRWTNRLDHIQGFRIGLVWAAGAGGRADGRSVPLSLFAPLSKIPGVTLVSVQKGDGATQISHCGFPILHLGNEIDDFADTAAILNKLDLLITVDTSVAHLGGTLGVTTWVLLKHVTDWRWFLDREDSPWYPSVRLFQQHAKKDWQGVIVRVATELATFAGQVKATMST